MEFQKQLMNWHDVKRMSMNSEKSAASWNSYGYTSRDIRDDVCRTNINCTEADDEALIDKHAAAMQEAAEWKPSTRVWLVIGTLSTLSLMTALDATILVAVLPSIAQALHGDSIDAFWAGTAYLLASAVFQPVIASMSNQFGRQQSLLFSITAFTVGTVICTMAQDFQTLHIGRSIQGIGGGGCITLTQCIFCDLVPLRQRPRLFSIVLGSWAVGSLIGPVLGGAFHNHWRWVFIINFPFCVLGIIMTTIFIRLKPVENLDLITKLKRTDWVGAFLFVGSITTILIGTSWGGIQYPWDSIDTLGPIVYGAAGLVAFLLWQLLRAPKSLLPTSIFYCVSAFAAFYCAMVNGLLLFTALYYVPLYYMAIKGHSPTKSGLDLFPALVFLLPGSIIVSVLTTKLGKYRWAIWTGWCITTLGCALLTFLHEDTSTAAGAAILAVFGVGSGMVLSGVNFGTQAISRIEDSAMTASMYGFFRSLGMPIGVALAGTIFQNGMKSKLKEVGLPDKIAHDSEGFIPKLNALKHTDPLRVGAIKAYDHGFQMVFITMTVCSATALLVSLLIKSFSLDKLLVSNFTADEDEQDSASTNSKR